MIQWDDSWSIGIEAIDRQHRHLVHLTNMLRKSITEGQGQRVVMSTLQDLVNYAAVHFNDEENLMAQTGFPSLEDHKKLHVDFKRKLAEFVLNHQEGNLRVPSDLMHFLVEWLRDHIKGDDSKFGVFYQEKT